MGDKLFLIFIQITLIKLHLLHQKIATSSPIYHSDCNFFLCFVIYRGIVKPWVKTILLNPPTIRQINIVYYLLFIWEILLLDWHKGIADFSSLMIKKNIKIFYTHKLRILPTVGNQKPTHIGLAGQESWIPTPSHTQETS